MVIEGIVLGQKIFPVGLEVDQEKVAIIKTLLAPTTVKGISSFLGYAGFYRRFIKDLSKSFKPLCRLLEKDAKFNFDESCRFAFDEIKSKLVTAPIMLIPDWNNDFKIMCVASVLQWELYWYKELERYSRPYTMPEKPSLRHKRTTLPHKRRC